MISSLEIAGRSDDLFHSVGSDDENWIETLWFPFWIPDDRITCYVHIHFCPNKGIYRGSVSVWKDNNEVLLVHGFEEKLLTLSEFGNLDNMYLPIGIRIRCLKPLQTYEVQFEHPQCHFNFIFEGIMLPVMITPDASPGMFYGHMNQAGMAHGEMSLGDKQYQINCPTVRDRSWGPRLASSGHRAGNCNATSKDMSLYIYVQPDEQGEEKITNGHLLAGGRLARVVAGERKIVWAGDLPDKIILDGEDEIGRVISARGQCLNQRVNKSPPNLYVVLNLVEWKMAGETLVGESHDVWSEDEWLASGKSVL